MDDQTPAGETPASHLICAYASKGNPSDPVINKLEESEKFRFAKKVYDTLVAAKGDFRFPVPTFVMSREEKRVAWMDYDALEIGLEEKAFEVCSAFGEEASTAIASLLGHELTHYYEKHAWRRHFVAAYGDLEVGTNLDAFKDGLTNETQADYLGGFLAYSAGYGVFNNIDGLMGKLYQAYGMPDDIGPNYPKLADRQALARRSGQKLERLVEVFEMANFLTAAGRFDQARLYFKYILQEYQSREIYNNLGVMTVLEALDQFNESEIKFRLPLELDLQSSRSSRSAAASTRQALLQEAIRHFDFAISLDQAYAPAYLNKACAYFLLDDTPRARFYAEVEAMQRATAEAFPKTAVDVKILRGIIAAQKDGDEAVARTLFEEAERAGSELAAANRKILLGQPLSVPSASAATLPKPERIDDISLAAYADDPQYDPQLAIGIADNLSFLQNPKAGPNSRIFISYDAARETISFFQVPSPGYAGTTALGIKTGDSREQIIEKYGTPKRSIETPHGQIMAYAKMLFILGPEGRLEHWVNFQL